MLRLKVEVFHKEIEVTFQGSLGDQNKHIAFKVETALVLCIIGQHHIQCLASFFDNKYNIRKLKKNFATA